jgi:glucose-1-phosphate thymidylyltransferase
MLPAMQTKGIVLAGGNGSRLYPLTGVVSKQLLPVYDKPMIYYPLATLLGAGIREILIISTEEAVPLFRRILGDGSRLGVRFEYAVQKRPEGIAQSFLIGEQFIGRDRVCLILGDNLFYGGPDFLESALQTRAGAVVFAYRVQNPERYGVVEFDAEGRPAGLAEKPAHPKSPYAVTGVYVYDHRVVEIARGLKPSARGELEITDVNNAYLRAGELEVRILDRGAAWLDTGTHRDLLDASNFIQTLEVRQGLKLGCIEEIAFQKGYIGLAELEAIVAGLHDSQYRDYLRTVLDEARRRPPAARPAAAR